MVRKPVSKKVLYPRYGNNHIDAHFLDALEGESARARFSLPDATRFAVFRSHGFLHLGEIGGMNRSELDMKAQTWTIPAERTKNKRSHLAPLSNWLTLNSSSPLRTSFVSARA
jgi:integrase